MEKRPIPSSGELVPVVGCGTYRGFDVAPKSAAYQALPGVLDALFAAGGTVLDSSPMYGRAERTCGELLKQRAAFIATKVWTRGRSEGIAEMKRSISLLGHVDLMQVHNLLDVRTHLDTLKGWKRDGLVRYVGVTHYHSAAHDELAQVMTREPLDFVQFDYSLEDRAAEAKLLPLAAERGIAVLVNLPFGGGGLLREWSRKPLPAFASQIGCTTWSQLLLKFVLGHPAVTCAIPGTGDPAHMAENAAAGSGDLEGARARVASLVD